MFWKRQRSRNLINVLPWFYSAVAIYVSYTMPILWSDYQECVYIYIIMFAAHASIRDINPNGKVCSLV